MHASSLLAAAWRCRRPPCAHPEVLRYARRVLLRPPGSPAHSLNSTAPAAAALLLFSINGYLNFVARKKNVWRGCTPVNRRRRTRSDLAAAVACQAYNSVNSLHIVKAMKRRRRRTAIQGAIRSSVKYPSESTFSERFADRLKLRHFEAYHKPKYDISATISRKYDTLRNIRGLRTAGSGQHRRSPFVTAGNRGFPDRRHDDSERFRQPPIRRHRGQPHASQRLWPAGPGRAGRVEEAVRHLRGRNSGLLAAAAAFSRATDLHRYSDAALECICHAELLEDLAELANVSAAEIGGMTRRHLRRVTSLDDYMRIMGVVKERVVCLPRGDGRMQLDDLCEDCWEMVRRFLMLDDVVETVTGLENF
ncbi:hypothetical protein HPB51_000315 [Rhipicephalus microplus]|uniref:Uncharacterized protein n=1 Tax=Rhipicephalus microplus TaxID=6941 RepID=A0A9J6EJL8_RHIMP|nr:hypothetical protein HPB51_000315 [Rhipicephalus microplus]